MIVPMKKVMLFVVEQERERALEQLGALGIVDLEIVKAESTDLERIKKEGELLEKALNILPKTKGKFNNPPLIDYAETLKQASQILNLRAQKEKLEEKRRAILAELERLSGWGEIDPEKIEHLAQRGIFLSLWELNRKELKGITQGFWILASVKARSAFRLVVASFDQAIELPGKRLRLPAKSTALLKQELSQLKEELGQVEASLAGFVTFKEALRKSLRLNSEARSLEEARLSLADYEKVALLKGFVPEPELPKLKKAAREEGWGLVIADPAPEEDVPTLIKRPPLLSIIKPVFDFLGTVPGYREYDVGLPFLFFFSIFFAMLVGDAGYGLLLLGFTFLGRFILKRLPAPLFGLLLVTSVATTVWGAITGTWFGSSHLAAWPYLRVFIIEPIATFSQTDNRKLLMSICFVIGLIHLSLAHLISFWRQGLSYHGLTDLGKLAIVWGMFFMVQYLVLQEPLNPAAPWLLGGGLGAVILFERQRPAVKPGLVSVVLNFLKGIGLGLANIFLTVLSAISSLADIISYVRLFAVGLASVEIARTFNNMAASLGGGAGILGILVSALVLFIGHALNLVLALMSVLVHGIRLNMLEFSGHLGMEWSGRAYTPFTLTTTRTSGKEN